MTIEEEIQTKGLTAPRITPQMIEDNICGEYYFTAADGVNGSENDKSFSVYHAALNLVTFCVLVTNNEFTVIGHSACASPENFDAEIGRKIARENAFNQLWPLMGYELKTKLMENSKPNSKEED